MIDNRRQTLYVGKNRVIGMKIINIAFKINVRVLVP
jgi:hypothetical protein